MQLSPGLNRGAIFSLQGVEQPARGAGKVLGNHNGGYYGPLRDAWDTCSNGFDYGICQIRIHSEHRDTISLPRLSKYTPMAAITAWIDKDRHRQHVRLVVQKRGT